MMGGKSGDNKLFYLFRLEDKVPPDHFLRQVSKVVDFRFIYDLTRSFYSHTGSPFFKHIVKLYQAAGLVDGNKIFLDSSQDPCSFIGVSIS